MKDNRESDQNRYSLFTVRDAENAMTAFTIFTIAVIVGMLLHELLIKGNNILSFLYVVVSNVSNILSAATLITVFEEGFNLMLFRRAREERAKLKEEKRELEELKQEIQDLQKVPQEGAPAPQPESVNAKNQPPEQSSNQPPKPENVKPNK